MLHPLSGSHILHTLPYLTFLQSGMLDFEDGTQYERTAGGCTAATAHRGGGGEGDSSSDEDDRAEGRGPGGVHSDEEDDLSD